LSTPDQFPTPAAQEGGNQERQKTQEKTRSVDRCNFRVAGKLSNEDARLLTSVHESIAEKVAATLDMSLGREFQCKFRSLREVTLKEYLAETAPISYAVPLAGGLVTLEFSLGLVFPLIELLMGGKGDSDDVTRDLSEIEEELMHDVVLQVMRTVESVWSTPGLSLVPGARVKSSFIFQTLRPAEKVTILSYEMAFGSATGWFQLVLARPFLDVLMKRIKAEQPQAKSKVRSFPAPPLRERMLDCEMEVAAELTELKVAVRDLVRLRPGSVLKLRAPVRTPGMLTAGGRELFEATPVRSGQQRAAQLGNRSLITEWKRI